jgi:hypothetical protein
MHLPPNVTLWALHHFTISFTFNYLKNDLSHIVADGLNNQFPNIYQCNILFFIFQIHFILSFYFIQDVKPEDDLDID